MDEQGPRGPPRLLPPLHQPDRRTARAGLQREREPGWSRPGDEDVGRVGHETPTRFHHSRAGAGVSESSARELAERPSIPARTASRRIPGTTWWRIESFSLTTISAHHRARTYASALAAPSHSY